MIGQIVGLGYAALCYYFFQDGKKHPHKYKPIKIGGDMYPIGAIIDEPNADFHVAVACIDAGLLEECCSALKNLKVKMSKSDVEDFISTHGIESVDDFVFKFFQEQKK